MEDVAPKAGEDKLYNAAQRRLRELLAEPYRCDRRNGKCRLVCGGACCLLTTFAIAWVVAVALAYMRLAACLNIELTRLNTTSLCDDEVHLDVSVHLDSPSEFALQVDPTTATIHLPRRRQNGGETASAVHVNLPAFEITPGAHEIDLGIRVRIVNAHTFGEVLNICLNNLAEPIGVDVRGAIRSTAIFGLPLRLPFSEHETIELAPASAPSPASPPAPPHTDPRAARTRKCGKPDQFVAPFELADLRHQFRLMWSNPRRLHVAGTFIADVASPADIVLIPNLSVDVCVRRPRTAGMDGLEPIAQVSTRAGAFVQPAYKGTSDMIVDALLTAEDSSESVLWNATSAVLAGGTPPLVLRGSPDEEVARYRSVLDRPPGYNTASGAACPLQRALQGVSVQLHDGWTPSPSVQALMRFASCAWQQLHRRGFVGEHSWAFGDTCALLLRPSGEPLLPLPELPGWAAASVGAPGAFFDLMPSLGMSPGDTEPGISDANSAGGAGSAAASGESATEADASALSAATQRHRGQRSKRHGRHHARVERGVRHDPGKGGPRQRAREQPHHQLVLPASPAESRSPSGADGELTSDDLATAQGTFAHLSFS